MFWCVNQITGRRTVTPSVLPADLLPARLEMLLTVPKLDISFGAEVRQYSRLIQIHAHQAMETGGKDQGFYLLDFGTGCAYASPQLRLQQAISERRL
jgi:hypothetical protein